MIPRTARVRKIYSTDVIKLIVKIGNNTNIAVIYFFRQGITGYRGICQFRDFEINAYLYR